MLGIQCPRRNFDRVWLRPLWPTSIWISWRMNSETWRSLWQGALILLACLPPDLSLSELGLACMAGYFFWLSFHRVDFLVESFSLTVMYDLQFGLFHHLVFSARVFLIGRRKRVWLPSLFILICVRRYNSYSTTVYSSTAVLSVQNIEFASCRSSSFPVNGPMRAAMVAAVNSERGMVVGLSGATPAFPMTNHHGHGLCCSAGLSR